MGPISEKPMNMQTIARPPATCLSLESAWGTSVHTRTRASNFHGIRITHVCIIHVLGRDARIYTDEEDNSFCLSRSSLSFFLCSPRQFISFGRSSQRNHLNEEIGRFLRVSDFWVRYFFFFFFLIRRYLSSLIFFGSRVICSDKLSQWREVDTIGNFCVR